MTCKASNPAPLATATGLGKVFHSHAIDTRVDTAPLADLQAKWLRRRLRIPSSHTSLFAELAWPAPVNWIGGVHHE